MPDTLAELARNAVDANLAPGAGWGERAAWGAAQVVRAARLVWRDRALRREAAVPVVLTALGCAALAALYTVLHEDDGESLRGPLSRAHVYMTTFVALASMPPTLLQRQWVRVAREARRALGLAPGEDPLAGRRLRGIVVTETVKAFRQAAVVAVGLFPVFVALDQLPELIHAPAIVAGAWAFYWVVVDAFELPIEVLPGPRRGAPEPWFARGLVRAGRSLWLLRPIAWAGALGGRLARPWREELHVTERHPWESAGAGIAAGLLLSVPVLGLAFRAVAIVAATALVDRLRAGEVPPPLQR